MGQWLPPLGTRWFVFLAERQKTFSRPLHGRFAESLTCLRAPAILQSGIFNDFEDPEHEQASQSEPPKFP
jgi:hypothetical protein